MKKVEFLKKWAKRATGGGAVEAFETDVELLAQAIIRCSTSAVVNGLMKGTEDLPPKDQEYFRRLIQTIPPAVEKAIKGLY